MGEESRGHWVFNEVSRKFESYAAPRTVQTHMVITDEIPPTEHPADGRIYTSRAKFKEATRLFQLEETAGEDEYIKKMVADIEKEKDIKMEKEILEDTTRAWYAVRDGNAPLTEKEKERCKQMEQKMKSE